MAAVDISGSPPVPDSRAVNVVIITDSVTVPQSETTSTPESRYLDGNRREQDTAWLFLPGDSTDDSDVAIVAVTVVFTSVGTVNLAPQSSLFATRIQPARRPTFSVALLSPVNGETKAAEQFEDEVWLRTGEGRGLMVVVITKVVLRKNRGAGRG